MIHIFKKTARCEQANEKGSINEPQVNCVAEVSVELHSYVFKSPGTKFIKIL